MRILRFLPVAAALLAGTLSSCIDEKIVAPDEFLPPILAVDRPTVQLFRFARGRQVAADTVRITNNGEGPLGGVEQVGGVDYITVARTGWLRSSIVNLDDDDALLVLQPTYAEDEQDQADVAEIVLKARNSVELKRVRIIARTLPGAAFEFSVSPLTFAAVPGDSALTQWLTVRNGGNGILQVNPPEISFKGGATGWIEVTRTGGSDRAPEFQIDARPELLPPGISEAFLVFRSGAQEETRARPDSVRIQLSIGQPVLATSVDTLRFTALRGGDNPPEQTVLLSNSGEGGFSALGTLSVGTPTYASGATGWLQLTRNGGELRVAALTSALGQGSSEARFDVVSEHGGTRKVAVLLSVAAPALTATPRVVAFGMVEGDAVLPAPQTVTLSNTGAGTFQDLGAISLGAPSPAVSWLSVTRAGTEVRLTPTTAALALASGSYTTEIPVRSANGGEVVLSVTYSVSRGNDPPQLALSATKVDFTGVAGGASPSPQQVQASNAGGGLLGALSLGTIAYGGVGGWLSVSLAGSTVTLTATTGALSNGTYTAALPVISANGGALTITVTFALGAPVLTASATSASFSAPEGAGNPPSQILTLSNTGSGTFASLGTVTVGGGLPSWLGAVLAGEQLTLSVTTSGLAAGTYNATVPVSSTQGGNLSIAVTFTVTRTTDAADLVVSPASVRMDAIRGGGNPPSQIVALSNGGGGSLGAITVGIAPAGAGSWLSATQGAGTLTLSATTGALAAGTYTATVNVSSANGGSEAVAVTFVVGGPVLTLSSASASFSGEEGGSASPASIAVGVSNTGAGEVVDLGVAVGSTGVGWLAATLSADTTQVSLTATLGALAAGTYTATVPVNSTAGGNASIAVTLTVTPEADAPALELSASSVTFFATAGGADPASQGVTISNGGGGGAGALGALSLGAISYGSGTGWLSASLAGSTVTVSPTTGTLAEGTYTATVPVQSTDGGNRSLAVTFTVTAAGAAADLAVSPAAVRADAVVGGGNPPDQIVNLYTAGEVALGTLGVDAVSYGSGSGWLSTSLAGSAVTLSFNSAGLAPGTYDATFQVTSTGGGDEVVAVTLVVAGPVLTLSSTSAAFSGLVGGAAAPVSTSVQLSNTGAGDFADLGTITVGATGAGWLSATLAGGDTRVDLSATIGALGAGTYTATVPVGSAHGGSGSIDVTLTVSPAAGAPVLALSTSTVDFTAVSGGSSPASRTVTLSNSGGGSFGDLGTVGLGTISYGSGASGWLSGSSLTGSTLTLVPATGSLSPGSYTATVPVNSQFGGNGSVAVTVTVGTPVLTASSLSLSFTGAEGGAPPSAQEITFSNTGAGAFSDLGTISVTSVGAGASWLTSPGVGATVVGGALSFSVNQGSLAARSYSTSVVVASQRGGNQTVGVTLTVVRATDPPQMVLSATSQRFDALVGGADPPDQSVVVSNAGGGSLDPIALAPTVYGAGAMGWLQATLVGTTITTRATTGSLPEGTFTATVPVSSAGGSVDLDVTFVVGTSRLTVSPRTVTFGDTAQGSGPAPVTVGLANTGGGSFSSLGAVTLQPTVYGTGGAGWLQAELATPSTVRLQAITGDLLPRPAPYVAWVPVSAALGGTDTIRVDFTVTPRSTEPLLALSRSSVVISATLGSALPPPERVDAFNAGGGDLGTLSVGGVSYLEGAQGWLQASIADRSVLLQSLLDGLSPGTHRATVRVASQYGGEGSVEVTLNVTAPLLTLSTRTVTFSDTVGSPDPLQTRVFLSNTGAGNREALGTLRVDAPIYADGASGWLTPTPAGGQTVTDFQVGITGSAVGLPAGSWQARVPVVSQWGGSDTIRVSFTTREPDRSFDLPTIQLVKDSVTATGVVRVPLPGDSVVVGPATAGTTQLSFRVGVRNGSRTRLNLTGLRVGIPTYPQGQPTGWITGAFLDQTSATFDQPTQLFVVVEPKNLAPGRYEGRLVISSESAGLEAVAPAYLRVVLVVS